MVVTWKILVSSYKFSKFSNLSQLSDLNNLFQEHVFIFLSIKNHDTFLLPIVLNLFNVNVLNSFLILTIVCYEHIRVRIKSELAALEKTEIDDSAGRIVLIL